MRGIENKLFCYKNYIMLFILFSIITACKNKDQVEKIESLKSVVENSLGKKLMIPDSLQVYSPFKNYIADSTAVLNSDYKIYSKLNASCGSCISHINLWNDLASEFRKYKVPIILICDSDDQFELIHYFCESGKIKDFGYPFFLDKKNEFAKINKFMMTDKNFETVLTDKNNTILLMGNPMASKGIKELYLKEIQKRIKEK